MVIIRTRTGQTFTISSVHYEMLTKREYIAQAWMVPGTCGQEQFN